MKVLNILFLASSLSLLACGGEKKAGDESANGKEELTTDAIRNPNAEAGADAADAENAPVLTFDETEHDFGTIKQGEKIDYNFTFTNTGKSDLIISNAKASCGCTVPEWPKDPIKPGESGTIPVVYNSKGKKGNQRKSITITANTVPSETQVFISAFVEVPEKQ